MSYLALYRKYRSKNFDELVGQEAIKQTLENSLKIQKISHAYLFSVHVELVKLVLLDFLQKL